ncbi:type I-C CRISPR-associated protein Cas8c/Csd1 [Bacilliculturomica massiliensis]|uniref:type I-C CRISPR-associated protein Cas8c/Csd1 n=1 Tax=Bacilliculturomica massiliensis TaxID=1917867 RepID=UPI0013EF17E8|nr:type I-C CRISPR-associated protein Cas8c/Csd1 [Bacilliculturomica massiliensis]
MSWISKLYQTYENCSIEIGRIHYDDNSVETGEAPLLPIAHTTMNANVQLTLNERAECTGAAVLNKKEGVTIIPCTEESAVRSGTAPVHHPLFDKLQYLAGDYEKYGGEKGGKFYESYMSDLERWCSSPYANPKVNVIFAYLKKGTLIGDLIRFGVLVCGEDGKLLKKWNGKKEDTPPILKAVTGSQLDAAVRIAVTINGAVSELWEDPKVFQDYIAYYLNSRSGEAICYGSGERTSCATFYPKKIVPFEANAKLISANDNDGFTYRGRFTEGSQVSQLSYEMSEKAHNALRWLIDKQGKTIDKQCFLAWGTKNEALPPVAGDTVDLVKLYEQREADEDLHGFTNEAFSKRFNKALNGYRANLDTKAEVIFMGLQAATKGRLSISFYREFSGNEFLDRVEQWHKICAWNHSYGFDPETKKRFSFEGAPSPEDIVRVGYGSNCGDKLKAALIARLVCCIVDGTPLPWDIAHCVIVKASNPMAYKEEWERSKALTIACALYRKIYFDRSKSSGKGEILPMSLDHEKRDRSYLYGRLLAVAHYMEQITFEKWNERDTNAQRYQCAFSKRPCKTWQIIKENLSPYETKLLKKPGVLNVCQKLIGEINDLFEAGEFEVDAPLDPLYLHGYECQLSELWRGKGDKKTGDGEAAPVAGQDSSQG